MKVQKQENYTLIKDIGTWAFKKISPLIGSISNLLLFLLLSQGQMHSAHKLFLGNEGTGSKKVKLSFESDKSLCTCA